MEVCRVVGQMVSTIKDSRLQGFKLLVCQAADRKHRPSGESFVAVDAIGAGQGDTVLVVRGAPAQSIATAPVDAAIVAIIDPIRSEGGG